MRASQTGFGAVMREQLGLAFGNVSKLALKCFSNTGVKSASRLAQEGAIGRILYQGVLEKISRVRSGTLSEEQSCRDEPVKCRSDGRFRLARHGSHKRM
jgi:hypothetical protein